MTATNVPTHATCLCGARLHLAMVHPTPEYRDDAEATACAATSDRVHVPTERKCAVEDCTREIESDDRVLCDDHRDRARDYDPDYDPYDRDR